MLLPYHLASRCAGGHAHYRRQQVTGTRADSIRHKNTLIWKGLFYSTASNATHQLLDSHASTGLVSTRGNRIPQRPNLLIINDTSDGAFLESQRKCGIFSRLFTLFGLIRWQKSPTRIRAHIHAHTRAHIRTHLEPLLRHFLGLGDM